MKAEERRLMFEERQKKKEEDKKKKEEEKKKRKEKKDKNKKIRKKYKRQRVKKTLVFVKDIEGFLKLIQTEREIPAENMMVRVSIDAGQGSLKVMANVFDKTLGEDVFGPGEEKGEKNTGVNRSLLLAHGEDWQELHSNLRIIVEILQLEKVNFSLAADLKLINCMLGLSNHSSTYACIYCEGTMGLKAGKTRTFHSLTKHHTRYRNARYPKNQQAKFKNCVHPCLLVVPDPRVSVLSMIPLPQLHLLLGCVNHLFNMLKDVMKKEDRLQKFLDWCKKNSISLRGLASSQLDGNNSKQLMKCADKLLSATMDGQEDFIPGVNSIFLLPEAGLPIIETMKAFNCVTSGTMSRKLDPTYKELIARSQSLQT